MRAFNRDPVSRLYAAVLACVFGFLCGFGIYKFLFVLPAPRGIGESIAKLFVEEILMLGFVYCLLELLWAALMPHWVERWFQWADKKFLTFLFLCLALGLVAAVADIG